MENPLTILMNAKFTVEQLKLNGVPVNALWLKIGALRNPGNHTLDIPPLVMEPSKARALLTHLQQAVEKLDELEALAPTEPPPKRNLQ